MYTSCSLKDVKVININHFIVFLNHNCYLANKNKQTKIFLNLKLVSSPSKKDGAEFCKHTEEQRGNPNKY